MTLPTPQFEFKINVVSLANFVALVGLLLQAMSSYSTFSTNWLTMQAKITTFQEQQASLQNDLKEAAAERKSLYERDADFQMRLVNLQAELTSKLTSLQTELRVLNTTVNKLETSLDRLADGSRRNAVPR